MSCWLQNFSVCETWGRSFRGTQCQHSSPCTGLWESSKMQVCPTLVGDCRSTACRKGFGSQTALDCGWAMLPSGSVKISPWMTNGAEPSTELFFEISEFELVELGTAIPQFLFQRQLTACIDFQAADSWLLNKISLTLLRAQSISGWQQWMDPLWLAGSCKRELQRMQQDLNSENFLWPSHGIDFRLSIKPIAGGDKFLSLHSYTVSIWAAVSASARSMALLPILPYVGLVTSSQHHLKSHQLQQVEEQMSWGCCYYLLTHRSQMQKTDQKTKEWTKLHWSTGVQQTDLSHATARWKAAYSGFSFQPAFLPQWCRTPVRQHPKGNSLSGKHWEKNGQGGSPGQGNPARPWKTHKNHLGSSSTHARRFFNLGSSAISAPPLLFVPLFLSPGTQ